MELYYINTEFEKALQRKADLSHIPLGGAMELLPICNMNCRMCYVRKSPAEMKAEGRMLRAEEWLSIARQGVKEGLMSLLLTGGEPLLYPEFKELYTGLSRMGILLCVNSNGTLIDEEWADFFQENGVRRINITLYGKDDETYAKLCQNPHGFTQVMKAARLLKERNVSFRFTCSVTPYNVHQLKDLFQIAQSFGVPFEPASYMFPPSRKGNDKDFIRLTPQQAAQTTLEAHKMQVRGKDMILSAKATLTQLLLPPRYKDSQGFTCHAGKSGFWMNWKGEMQACGMFNGPSINLQKHTFKECWDFIVDYCSHIRKNAKCANCPKQNLCMVCPASRFTETGSTDGCPEYLCEMTDEEIRLCENILEEAHTEKTLEIISPEEAEELMKKIRKQE